MEGKAIIFSAPSGSGKTTIVHQLLNRIPSLRFSISSTTRQKRSNEKEGEDYFFLSIEDFQERIAQGELLEWEEVYSNTFYGTLKSEVERIWKQGHQVVFDVDVQGGLKLKKQLGKQALAVFIKVPTMEVLEQRLAARKTEDESSLKARISKARQELLEEKHFDQVVINNDLETAVEQAYALVQEFIKE